MLHGPLLLVFAFLGLVCGASSFSYYIGVGRYDITGPAAEINMMGYAKPGQETAGIHIRQWSRAYIFAEASNKSKRMVFVNIDACMGTQIMKMEVVKKLKSVYNDLYTEDNVCISATHTHSGPGGYFQYLLYEVTSEGFVNASLNAIVEGIVGSISRAHDNMVEGRLFINQGDLHDASINRSPSAYPLNPEAKDYDSDVDTLMTVLKMTSMDGKELGMISWFAVHCTSMNNSNELISSDNKGYASLLMEFDKDPGSLPGKGKFVAAFAQSNEGDVSPNIEGARCRDTGNYCDTISSTCNGRNENCIASGPGKDMFDSTRIIGERQYNKAKELYENAPTEIIGNDIRFVHLYEDFSNIEVTINGTKRHTCSPAMGDSFAAGTIDGPGAFSFRQNDTTGNALWDFVGHILHDPSKEQQECQHPKPILLDTGSLTWPYPWSPKIVPLQIMSIGQLVIVAVPAEFTTMSGRLLRKNVAKVLQDTGKFYKDAIVVIAGLANTYSDYVATRYEYQQQRYEAASTIFGPYTLDAYIQEFSMLAKHLAMNTSAPNGTRPPNYLSEQVSFRFLKFKDAVPSGKKFGGLYADVDTSRTYKVYIPDLLRKPSESKVRGMLQSRGEQWRRTRRILSKSFNAVNLSKMSPIIERSCESLMMKLSDHADAGKSFDIWKLYGLYTMEVILATGFGHYADVINGEANELSEASASIFAYARENSTSGVITVLTNFPFLEGFIRSRAIKSRSAKNYIYLESITKELVRKRLEEERVDAKYQDLLQLLIDARAESDDEDEGEAGHVTFIDPYKRKLTDVEIVRTCISFLLAGHETTNNALGYTSYLLALHTDQQDKLYEEISGFYAQKPGASLYEAAQSLTYMDMVVQESLRIFPPAPLTNRHTSKTIEINGQVLPKGSTVVVPIMAIHHSPDIWPEPSSFRPERFTKEEKEKRHQMAHMPFGWGPRSCIGMRFALMEAKMALIAIMKEFKFVEAPDTEKPLRTSFGITMIPTNGIHLKLERRH